MIKPLPSFFHFVGFGPLNLGAFLQARVSVHTDVYSIAHTHASCSTFLKSGMVLA